MGHFRELVIWKDALKLVKEIYLLSKSLPETENNGWASQNNRYFNSMPANIAEKAPVNSPKEILCAFFKYVRGRLMNFFYIYYFAGI